MAKRFGKGRSRPRPNARGARNQPPLRKAGISVAPSTPAVIDAYLGRAGMDNSASMGPGRPLNPYRGYSGPPRRTDYPVAVNISTRSRESWDRASFDTLRAIIKSYDVARMCINHKIDELRSMELMFVAADGVSGDVDGAIDAARAALAFPDRELPYEDWLSKWLENVLKFDAAPLYRRRNMDGEVIGLEVLDGTTVMPYIDENGRRPAAPGPAYYQLIHGVPWNWYTSQDIDYRMFRPQEDSPFGLAPMESILLTANTDLRFQWHFLQLFTDGSVPAGFIELPPDVSSPDQVAEWQDYWDAMIQGDQAKLHQLIAVPAGTKVTSTKPAAFDVAFPEYLQSRTCAMYGVVPQDIGLVKDVNRANGETQTDIQFRVNTLPWVYWVQNTLTRYLQYDLRLPVKAKLNTGRDVEDRVAEAQAWQIYIESGMASADEGREKVLGLPVDADRPTPRFFSTTRSGPIPLLAIAGIAGRTDPETYGPADDQPIVYQPFVAPPGVIPAAGTTDQQASAAAEDAYQTQMRQQLQAEGAQPPAVPSAQLVAKGDGAAELAAFRRFVKARRREGRWRDFQFTALDGAAAEALNAEARDSVTPPLAKAATAAPGLTKRSGMISLDLETGTVPTVPGGVSDHHVTVVYLGKDVDDAAFAQACARAGAAAASLPGPIRGTLGGVDCFEPSAGSDGLVPAFAPVELPGAHQLRDMLADLSASEHTDYHPHVTLAYLQPGDPLPDPVPNTPVTFTHLAVHRGPDVVRIPLGPDGAQVAKAGEDGPKAPPPAEGEPAQSWPGWQLDLAAAAYWAPLIAAALGGSVSPAALAQAYLATHPAAAEGETKAEAVKRLTVEARAWVQAEHDALEQALTQALEGAWTDGYLIGATSAQAVIVALEAGLPLADAVADVGDWAAGDTEAARMLLGDLGDGSGLRALLDEFEITIKSIADSRLDELGRALAEGAARGDSADTIAADITALLSNPSRAHMIATTELNRAVSAAAVNGYRDRGYREIEWLSAEDDRVCPICFGNEDAGAVRIGEPFPSGALRPPGHPWCRCAAQVVISSREGGE